MKENTTLVPLQDKISNDRGGMEMRELHGKINKTNRFALYFAIRKNNALDWWTGTKIENTLKIEFHHIFPKKILRDANYSDAMINDIRNIAIVSKKANGQLALCTQLIISHKKLEIWTECIVNLFLIMINYGM